MLSITTHFKKWRSLKFIFKVVHLGGFDYKVEKNLDYL